MAITAGAIAIPALVVAPNGHAASSYYCSPRLTSFVDTLAEIDGTLDVGLNFRTYKTLLTNANVAYARVPWRRTSGGCLSNVGVPAERALNYYAKAHNVWAGCINRLGNCTTGYVDAQIQRHWRNASANVERAINNLDN
jgi:hypothetical protein